MNNALRLQWCHNYLKHRCWRTNYILCILIYVSICTWCAKDDYFLAIVFLNHKDFSWFDHMFVVQVNGHKHLIFLTYMHFVLLHVSSPSTSILTIRLSCLYSSTMTIRFSLYASTMTIKLSSPFSLPSNSRCCASHTPSLSRPNYRRLDYSL